MSPDTEPVDSPEIGELEELADAAAAVQEEAAGHPLAGTPEYAAWTGSYCTDSVPRVLLDSRLRIVAANPSFCRLFNCRDGVSGQYFTQFFAPFFDAARSAELFRTVRSPEGRHRWDGLVEKQGAGDLATICNVVMEPYRLPGASTCEDGEGQSTAAEGAEGATAGEPRCYSATCDNITRAYRQLEQRTFSMLLYAARLKDNDTGNHIERVNRYAQTLAGHLLGRPEYPQVDRQFVKSIAEVAALHDVGKIGTPDDILNKAGPLEEWEWKVMKDHTKNGAYLLAQYPVPMAAEIALRHHEKWDGTGYPYQLSGELIPLSARVVSFADVYDALRMKRSYKQAFTHEKAVETIRAQTGTHFDPGLMERFLEVSDAFGRIFSELADSP
jgi:HD-GYP domain-containing protein (c-di-GMP phosphodiesterase class II)